MYVQSKIVIRFGSLEINYTGTEQFIKKEIPEILNGISKIVQGFEPDILASLKAAPCDMKSPFVDYGKGINEYVLRLQASSCIELILASCIYLENVHQLEQYTRRDILKEMKNAKGVYKPNYSNNLTNSLGSLEKDGSVQVVEKGVYRLSAAKRKELQAVLNIHPGGSAEEGNTEQK